MKYIQKGVLEHTISKWTNWIRNPGSGQIRPYALAKESELHPVGWWFSTGLVLSKYIHLPGLSGEGKWASMVEDDCLCKPLLRLEGCPTLSVLG